MRKRKRAGKNYCEFLVEPVRMCALSGKLLRSRLLKSFLSDFSRKFVAVFKVQFMPLNVVLY
jgi:hypothetical protein